MTRTTCHPQVLKATHKMHNQLNQLSTIVTEILYYFVP